VQECSGQRRLGVAAKPEALDEMKKVIILTLLLGAFLGGYYLGHQPNSPDVFGWADKVYHRVVDAGKQVVSAVGEISDDSTGAATPVCKK
jgi:hypothetical protein